MPARREPQLLGADVRDEIRDERRADDGDAAHRGRSRLLHMRMRKRAVVADLLTDVVAFQDPDEQRRTEDGQHERHRQAHEQGDHEATSALASPRTTRSSPTAWLPLTSTASPRPTRPASAASAPGASGASITSASPLARAASASGDARVPHDDEEVDAGVGGEAADGRVRFVAVRTELEHLAEDGDAAEVGAHRGERLERGGHRRGTGVVGIVEQERARGGVDELQTAGVGLHRREAGDDGVERHAVRQRHRRRERGVDHLVRAAHREADATGAPGRVEHERRPQRGVERDRSDADLRVGGGLDRDAHDARVGAGRQLRGRGVTGVEHGQPVGRQRLDERALLTRDAGGTTEQPRVREPDVGDHTDRRARDRGTARRCRRVGGRPFRAPAPRCRLARRGA